MVEAAGIEPEGTRSQHNAEPAQNLAKPEQNQALTSHISPKALLCTFGTQTKHFPARKSCTVQPTPRTRRGVTSSASYTAHCPVPASTPKATAASRARCDIGFDVRVPAKAHPELKHYFREFRSNNKNIRGPGAAKTRKSALRIKAFGLLAIIADDLGLKRPASYGPGFIGKWLRTTQEQNQSKSETGYDRWSPSSKRNTTKLLKHNEHDCRATEYLLKWLQEH
jgi:hypothetical protein